MRRKDRLDRFGITALTVFAALMAFNQIVVKVVNQGFQPIFFAGLRSAIAMVCLVLWLKLRGRPAVLDRAILGPGIAIGAVFAAEFLFLFLSLDLTTVTHTAVILYSMPVWLAIGAHFLLPGERITPARGLGLGLAFAGVAVAILYPGAAGGGGGAGGGALPSGGPSLPGDLLALLAAMCWAGIALLARGSRLRSVPAETQLLWQLAVSAVILLVVSPLFGPLIRDLQPIHYLGLIFQATVIAAAGFLTWLWLLSVYPAASVASFSFLSPVFGVAFGWLLLGEEVGPGVLVAAVLVAAGIVLINRPRPAGSGVTSREAGRAG